MTGKQWVSEPEAETENWYRNQARTLGYQVDEDTVVSLGDDPGAYVQIWTWIEAPHCETCGELVTECQGECEEEKDEPGDAAPGGTCAPTEAPEAGGGAPTG